MSTFAEPLEKEVTQKANDWKFWNLLNKSLSNTMSIIVIGGGIAATAPGFAGDQIKTFIDPKAFAGWAGAAVVAAKLAEDNFKFGKKSEEYENRQDKAEMLVSAIKTANSESELNKLRDEFLKI